RVCSPASSRTCCGEPGRSCTRPPGTRAGTTACPSRSTGPPPRPAGPCRACRGRRAGARSGSPPAGRCARSTTPGPRRRAWCAGAPARAPRRTRTRESVDTRAAAAAVRCGRPTPRADAHEDALREIGRTLHLPLADLASAADPGALFAAARAALAPLLRENGRLSARDRMTKCEQVAALLSAVAVDRLHWELLAQCVEHGASHRIDRETLLQCLVSDPEWAPHPDVCAGGDWYLGLERLRSVAAAARAEGTAAQRGTARCAWRAL